MLLVKMSFKRPRINHYGIHKDQIIVQNGVGQLSPLDRKKLPLDQQKQVSLSLSSDDRDGASNIPSSSPTDCVVNFVDGVKAVYAYRVLSFSFLNNFYSIQNGLNEQLQVEWKTAPTFESKDGDNFADVNAGIITLLEGYYKFTTEPAEWYNPELATQSNLNDIKFDDRKDLVTYYGNDIRVALLDRACGAITEIKTSRISKRITIIWATSQSPTIIDEKTNIADTLGISRISTGTTWTGIGPVICTGPGSIALVSDILNNSELVDPDGPNQFFLHVPVVVKQGERQLYMPQKPPLVNLNAQSAMVRIPLQIVDHKTQRTLNGSGIQWQLILGVYSTDATPAA